jgi:CheY-like chemotaxis protein
VSPDSKPILIVDDDEPTQKLLQALMRRNGHETVLASNGREAIDLLRDGDFSLVILDLMMPTVAGRDVIDFLSTAPSYPPVILCTAAGPASTRDVNLDIVKAVVRKPFDIDQLSALAAELMKR